MWKIIYNFLANLALPVFILYALTHKKIRTNLLERLSATTKGAHIKDATWIHAASVGEAAIAENLINYLKKHTNLNHFIITTNTYYTQDLLRTKFGKEIPVFSLPLDLNYLVSHFIAASVFKALVIIETEIWPNLIWQAKKRHIPVVIINGRISDHTVTTYRRFTPFLSHVLNHVDHVAAQSDEHRKRFVSIGMDPQKITTTGNIKYYRMLPDDAVTTVKSDVITFGSVKEKELGIVLPVICALKKDSPETLIYIAPRELHLTTFIENELSKLFRVARFSALEKEVQGSIDVVVVDTIGDLVGLYAKSRVAFVGGSLAPYGGQNILEPLFFATPVIFGPYMENFREIADIILENNAGVMVRNGDELYVATKNIMADDSLQQNMGNAGRLIIQKQQEVMKKTVDVIVSTINAGNRPQSLDNGKSKAGKKHC
jgi:3-deoxy-D-manno-octulosonic-acid transferase